MHRTRLLKLASHLEKAASDESVFEAIAMPLQTRVAEDQCGREEEGNREDLEPKREPIILWNCKSEREQ